MDRLVRLAIRIHPGLDELDAIEIGAVRILDRPHHETRCGSLFGWLKIATHRHATGIGPLQHVGLAGEVLRKIPAAEETHPEARAAGRKGFAALHRVPDRIAGIRLGPHAGQRPRVQILRFEPSTHLGALPSCRRAILQAMAARPIVFLDIAGHAVMAVGATDKTELVGVGTQLLLPGKTTGHACADEIALLDDALAEFRQRIGVLEIGKLVGGPELAMDLRIALDLHHLDQGLEMRTLLGIAQVQRLAPGVRVGEHQSLAGIGVVRNRQHVDSLFLETAQPLPQGFLARNLERTHRQIGHLRAAEDHVAVQICPLGRRAPLECDQRGEAARIVVLLGRIERDLPGALRGLGACIERRMLRLVAPGIHDHVLEEPLPPFVLVGQRTQLLQQLLIVTRRAFDHRGLHLAEILRMIGDRGKIERLADAIALAERLHRFALRETVGISRSEPRPADIGVERIGGMKMRFAKVGIAQRVGIHDWRRLGVRRDRRCHLRCRSLRRLVVPWRRRACRGKQRNHRGADPDTRTSRIVACSELHIDSSAKSHRSRERPATPLSTAIRKRPARRLSKTCTSPSGIRYRPRGGARYRTRAAT